MTLGDLGHSEEHRRLELALEMAGLGEFEWDMAAGRFVVSARMAAITGLPSGAMPAQGTKALEPFIHPDDLEAFRADKNSQRPAGVYRFEFRHLRPDDGRTVWLRVAGVLARRGFDGRPAEPSPASSRTSPSTSWRKNSARPCWLSWTTGVKNALATVSWPWLSQTAKRTTSLDAFLTNFSGRLKAMGSANELLTAARWRGAAIDHLAAAELGALSPGQTAWEGPELFLTPRAANALALGLHELAANAVKFGALSVETGRVSLRWARLPDGGFELTWTESGGPTVSPPTRRGFGSTLLEQVTGRELNGEAAIDYRPAGVQVRLRAGAAAVAPRPETVPEAPTARAAETVVTVHGGPTSLPRAGVLDRRGRRPAGHGAGDRPLRRWRCRHRSGL